MNLILHNIRSVHNVGSIFRTADAAGVSKIFLSGYTPTPIDRFGRERKDFAKVSLGAEKTIPWEHCNFIARAIELHKREDYYVVAVEQAEHSTSLFDFKAPFDKARGKPKKIALVFGNEVRGISKAALKLCDEVVEIPMHGAMVRQAHHPHKKGRGKESLNVSVAAGVVMFMTLK